MPLTDPNLAQLADAYGIATQFWDWKGRLVQVEDATVVGILRALDVDASSPESAQDALRAWQDRSWRQALPPCVVLQEGHGAHLHVHVDAGSWARVTIRLEDGGEWNTYQSENNAPDREIDGRWIGEATFYVPEGLPLGYHRVELDTEGWSATSTLIVTPRTLPLPAAMGGKRVWGYATQLYSVRSNDSWGLGDLGDLADLATWAATQQFADYVLVNPLHAAEPMPPLEPSPYLPASRRYVNPIYLRPEAVVEYATLDDADRARIATLKEQLRKELEGTNAIERDTVWTTKLAALRIIFEAGRTPARQMSFDQFCRREGRVLQQFATWSVLVQHLGMAWRSWPTEFQRPSSPQVREFAEEHADDITFAMWLQWAADRQLSLAQRAARDSGMKVGVMTDLAVGVSKESAEAWVLGDAFAQGVSVGAPPDHYNQLGQDWGQAPWRPDRLEELAYAPFRAMVAGNLSQSGGLRVDHIMGLFRLWWIPEGMNPTQGSYVRYNHEAMVGIVALEALRAGALVVGEDLGTVEPWVREYLAARGILGTSVAWFENQEDGWPLPSEDYRALCMASVTTHDMAPTAGYLAKDHLALQEYLGLLTEDVDAEIAHFDEMFARWRHVLTARGYVLEGEGEDDVEDLVLAMHRYIAASPALVLCAALVDAVGERQTQNQPGTVDQYPNWRVPLSFPDGRPMQLEDVFVSERAARLAAVMNGFSSPLNKRR